MKHSGNRYTVVALSCLLWLALLSAAGLPAWPAQQTMTEGDTLPRIKSHPFVAGYESVFMITDRETYIAGENVWFSMFARISGTRSIPGSVAGYAEILNSSNTPVAQCRILLAGKGDGAGSVARTVTGTGKGLLALPDSLSSGEYLLRGYTRAMTPYGPEHFFTRIIRVFNPYSHNTGFTLISPEKCPAGPSIELFPEGGTLLKGRPSGIVIRTSGNDGKGTAATVILNYGDVPNDDTIRTGKNGLGSAVVPAGATSVRAVAKIDSEITGKELNGNIFSRHALKASGTPIGNTAITVSHARDAERASEAYLSLVVINRHGVAFYDKFRPVAEDDVFEIPEAVMAHGINECLLYDHTGSLLSSLLFLNAGKSGNIPADEEVNLFTEEGILRVLLPEDSLYVTISASLSVDGYQRSGENYAILSEWVSAGTLADPFMQPFLKGEEEITDELLMTLRDRHLEIESGSLKQVVAETRGLAVDCSVTGLNERGPAKDKMLFINLPGKECFIQYAVSNEEGRLTFIVPPRTGTREIVIYPRDTTENLLIKTVSPFFSEGIPLRRSSTDITRFADPAVIRMSLNSQVMRIYQVRDTDTAAVTPHTLTGNHFYGTPDQRLVLANYVALPEMEEFFFELIPGWNLVKTRSGYELRVFDQLSSSEIRATPLMLIDGTCTVDPGTIASLSPNMTEYIDVCSGNFRLGEVLLPPIVSLVTTKGDYGLQSLPTQSLRIKYLFSNPDIAFRPYTGDASGHMPKIGNTLLWVPLINSGEKMELSFHMPRPDYRRPVTIRLTIFDSDGYLRFYTRTIDSGGL